ncbi:hypothetical protein F5Y10DRAFT_109954 [Nemania abortiva]|nr:hypothetical protein F5Y10DRAFT_109954 [Nemania abortiva]
MALDAPTSTFSLLSFPAEIRNAIYELVVKTDWGHPSQDYFVLDRPLPALFRVCRQIRSEALDVFLIKNRFHVYTSSIGLKWLDLLGKDVRRFRFLILFLDHLSFDAWHRYLRALLPLASDKLELRIRRAAASLSDQRLDSFLKDAGLLDEDRWISERNDAGEFIFRQVKS